MKKLAYCLGINNYDGSDAYAKGGNLNGCIQDTETMKAILLKAGFDVITLTDAQCTKARVAKIYEEFTRHSEPGDLLAFCVSAHGTFKIEKGERHTGICLWDGVLWDSDYRAFLANVPKNRGVIHIADTCFSQDNWKSVANNINTRRKLKTLAIKDVKSVEQTFTLKYAKALKINCNVIAYTSSTMVQPSYDLGSIGGHFTLSLSEAVKSQGEIANYFDVFNKTLRIMSASDLPQTPTFATCNGNVWKWTYRNFLG